MSSTLKQKQQIERHQMVLGLGDDAKKSDAKKKDTKKSNSNNDEAAEMLKKMEAKKAAGDCPFC